MSGCEILRLAPQATAVVRGDVALVELQAFFTRAFAEVFAALSEQGIVPAGPPFGRYAGPPADGVEIEAGVPVGRALAAAGEVVPGRLPGGRVATLLHVGPFTTLGHSYDELERWIAEQGLTPRSSAIWESYLTSPQSEPDPARWRTRIFRPVR
jgi:effector-binding domain-containing protein